MHDNDSFNTHRFKLIWRPILNQLNPHHPLTLTIHEKNRSPRILSGSGRHRLTSVTIIGHAFAKVRKIHHRTTTRKLTQDFRIKPIKTDLYHTIYALDIRYIPLQILNMFKTFHSIERTNNG
jgi:hypothetical protein